MHAFQDKKAFIIDMDGVIYHGQRLIPGAKEFVAWLQAHDRKFLFLTNSSERTPRDLCQKLARMDLQVTEEHFYTSALATASFLAAQRPGGTAFVIGEPGLTTALYAVGYTMSEVHPDYVVVGETRSYNFEKIDLACQLVRGGARLIGTNSDVSGPTEHGLVPATGALIKPIELTTGAQAYFVGKPNPLIMRHALKKLGCTREETAIIGDRMDTDIVAGIEAEIETVLVLSGVTQPDDLTRYAYRPHHVIEHL